MLRRKRGESSPNQRKCLQAVDVKDEGKLKENIERKVVKNLQYITGVETENTRMQRVMQRCSATGENYKLSNFVFKKFFQENWK